MLLNLLLIVLGLLLFGLASLDMLETTGKILAGKTA